MALGAGVAVLGPISVLDVAGAGVVVRALTFDAPFVTTLVHRPDVHPSSFVRRFPGLRDEALGRAAAMRGEGSADRATGP